ncbi:hypothetical protein [Burkholderia pseudomallei]|uniref:hypothetical protein n=1 Tax=Burkholderia pseudomallei TaxID=28450 RepID=UPI000F11A47B|nr:hypothetical protein [Burkholderia pseudomallei]VBT28178.1 Uncharacterised protein [Burkholderia pseudomallei]
MDLMTVHAILSSDVTLKKLAKIETSLTRVLEAELREHLSETDALSSSIAMAAVRDAIFGLMWARLLATCESAFSRAQANIESATVAASDASERAVDIRRSRNVATAAVCDATAALVDPVDRDSDADTHNRTYDELRAALRNLETENTHLREENRQLRCKLKKLAEKQAKLEAIAEFEPKFNDAPRDVLMTINVNKQLLARVRALAKDWGFSIDTYVCRALVIVDDEAEQYIGRKIPYS